MAESDILCGRQHSDKRTIRDLRKHREDDDQGDHSDDDRQEALLLHEGLDVLGPIGGGSGGKSTGDGGARRHAYEGSREIGSQSGTTGGHRQIGETER